MEGPAETVNIFRGSGSSFPRERRRVSVADWRRGSPQGSPTPSLEGALREAVSFRAGSPGFRGVLPLAGGGTEQEPASEEPLMWGRGWGGRVGSMWEPCGPPAAQVEQAPGGDAGAKAGPGGPAQEPRRRQVPQAFRPVPCSLTKAKRAPGRKQALEERRLAGVGVSCAPRTQSRPRDVRRGLGLGRREPLPVEPPDLGPSVGPVGILRPL